MAAEAPAPPAPTTTARERWTIYLMLSGQIMNNLAIRFGLPALLLFMRQEFGWNDLQFARITGSFFSGCLAFVVGFAGGVAVVEHVVLFARSRGVERGGDPVILGRRADLSSARYA